MRNSFIEDENGKWMFVPSFSGKQSSEFPGISQACINATMDVALVSELLGESDSGL